MHFFWLKTMLVPALQVDEELESAAQAHRQLICPLTQSLMHDPVSNNFLYFEYQFFVLQDQFVTFFVFKF